MNLKIIATYGLGTGGKQLGTTMPGKAAAATTTTTAQPPFLNIARGSIIDFGGYNTTVNPVGAIVNAANQGCLGGGGVDRAINNAGGPNLWTDREALPLLNSNEEYEDDDDDDDNDDERFHKRCNTGGAVVTGPGDYGKLKVPYVIHAVGPAYSFSGDDHEKDDALLRSAYQKSLDRCKETGVTDVGFSLLSAGVFRGNRSLEKVLEIGVLAIRDWFSEQHDWFSEPSPTKKDDDEDKATNATTTCTNTENAKKKVQPLQTVTLCGFTRDEIAILEKVCRDVFKTANEGVSE